MSSLAFLVRRTLHKDKAAYGRHHVLIIKV